MKRTVRLERFAAAAVLALGMVARAGAQEEEEGADHARRRWEWFYRQRAHPFAQIPAGALQRAREQLARTRLLQLNAVPPISGSQWESIGPTLINASAIGRASTVAVHPQNGSVMYLGGAQGGVWKTVDGGTSWVALTDKECSLAMGSIAIDPVNPEIVYAATGEQHFSGDSYYGCGVLRSVNGGATWTRLGAATFVRSRIARVLIVPTTAGNIATTTLLVASDNGLWRSTDGGASWAQTRTGTATDVVLDPSNPAIVYAATRGAGVFRSVDGGVTFPTPVGSGFPTTNVGRINIAIAASQPSTLVAAIHNSATNQLLGVFKTTDGAASWAPLSATGATCETQCWYDLYVAIHPTDPNIVYFGGVLLFRSLDGGQTFQGILGGIHVDQHSLTFDPQNPSTVYVTNDGGLYRSTTGGGNWTALNNGLSLTQFYSGIALHPWESSIVLGGTQDNGTLAYTGSTNWLAVIGGDGGSTAIDHENPLRRYGETQWTTGSSFGGPRRSDNGGTSFTLKRNGINSADGALFIPPMVMDPTNPGTLYFGTDKVYRTTDAAENWSAISPVFTGVVSAMAPAPSNPAVVYAGSTTGQLRVTQNGETWNIRTSGLPARFITDIAVDRSDENTAYVTVSGFGSGHVFRTVNQGLTWTNVSSNLPDMPVNAVALDPASRRFVMLGTDLGVFVSSDSGSSWTVLDAGMPNVAVFDIAYNSATATLIAATHGRGMFKLQLDRPLTLAAVPRRRRVDVVQGATAPVPDSASVVLSGTGGGATAWTATHTSAAWLTLTSDAGTGSGRVRWTRNPSGLAPGFYVDTITVAAAGAFDSPSRVIDTLFVELSIPALSLDPLFRKVGTPAGSNVPIPDSAAVQLTGFGSAQQVWTATARLFTWLSVISATGTGPGRLRWTRNPTGLNIGTYHDTIVVTALGATGSPASIVDSLIVQPAFALAPTSRRDTLVSGGPGVVNTIVQLTSLGDPDGTVAWTATHGAGTWLTLTTMSGQGNGTIAWTKSAANLRDGMFVDTITVNAAGAVPQRLIDTLVVIGPAVSRTCVLDHMLGAPCLDAAQIKWLDLAGNRDGVYNLGDLLSYLARPATPAPPALRRKEEQ